MSVVTTLITGAIRDLEEAVQKIKTAVPMSPTLTDFEWRAGDLAVDMEEWLADLKGTNDQEL